MERRVLGHEVEPLGRVAVGADGGAEDDPAQGVDAGHLQDVGGADDVDVDHGHRVVAGHHRAGEGAAVDHGVQPMLGSDRVQAVGAGDVGGEDRAAVDDGLGAVDRHDRAAGLLQHDADGVAEKADGAGDQDGVTLHAGLLRGRAREGAGRAASGCSIGSSAASRRWV